MAKVDLTIVGRGVDSILTIYPAGLPKLQSCCTIITQDSFAAPIAYSPDTHLKLEGVLTTRL